MRNVAAILGRHRAKVGMNELAEQDAVPTLRSSAECEEGKCMGKGTRWEEARPVRLGLGVLRLGPREATRGRGEARQGEARLSTSSV